MTGERTAPSPGRELRVLLLASGVGDGLAGTLGAARAREVQALLLARAQAWAERELGAVRVERVAGASFAAALGVEPPGADEVPASAAGSASASGSALAPGSSPPAAAGGPVVVLAPELAVWHPELAGAVLTDLEAGCALSLAPIFDRGLYLLALASVSPELGAALGALDLTGPGGMAELMGLASREEWQVGLLRAERGLRRERDVRALLADPLTDPELRALLEGWGGGT